MCSTVKYNPLGQPYHIYEYKVQALPTVGVYTIGKTYLMFFKANEANNVSFYSFNLAKYIHFSNVVYNSLN